MRVNISYKKYHTSASFHHLWSWLKKIHFPLYCVHPESHAAWIVTTTENGNLKWSWNSQKILKFWVYLFSYFIVYRFGECLPPSYWTIVRLHNYSASFYGNVMQWRHRSFTVLCLIMSCITRQLPVYWSETSFFQ